MSKKKTPEQLIEDLIIKSILITNGIDELRKDLSILSNNKLGEITRSRDFKDLTQSTCDLHKQVTELNKFIGIVHDQLKCPKCGDHENQHPNIEWGEIGNPIYEILCNNCGEFYKTRRLNEE